MSFEVPEPTQSKLIHLDQIQDKTFSSAWKGYRIEEVRGYLAQVALEVEKLSMELDAARAKIEELGAVRNQGNDGLSSQVLNAEETAAQILHDANEAAKALRDQAGRVLEFSRLKAEDEARELIESARAQSVALTTHDSEGSSGLRFEEVSKRELEQARRKATEIIERAKADGRGMIDQARDLRNEILADLRNKRSVLDGEIADLATRRIEAYQSLARAVQLISEAGTIIVSNEHYDPSALDQADGPDPAVAAIWEGQDFRQQDYHSDSAPAASVIELGKPALGDQDRYQAKITSSQVEIGAHLEEGIVRVFHKDVSGSQFVKAFVEPSGDLTSDSNDADFLYSGDGDVSIEVEPGQSALVSESSLQIDDMIEAGAPKDLAGERELGLQEAGLEGPEVEAVDFQDDQWVDPVDSERETPEDFHENLVRSDLEDLHESQSAASTVRSNVYGVQRSRRADEILLRIRSLRFGQEEPTSSGNGNKLANDPISVETGSSPKDNSAKGVVAPKIFSQSNSAESIVRETEIPSDNEAAEEPYYQGSDLTEIPQEIDAATEELLDVREELLAPIATMLFKKVKRLLADEQNDLLDKVRRSSGSEVVLEKLLEEKAQIDAMAIASLDFFEQVRLGVAELFSETNGGAARRDISRQAVEYSEEFAKEVILPLRRRIEEALAVDATVEDQSTAGALGAIYRDIRSSRLEQLISQYANTVFCATVLRESGYESFLWVTDPQDTPCADCMDNSLAGSTLRGEQFPTGHSHPGIHSGCRCLLVPFIA